MTQYQPRRCTQTVAGLRCTANVTHAVEHPGRDFRVAMCESCARAALEAADRSPDPADHGLRIVPATPDEMYHLPQTCPRSGCPHRETTNCPRRPECWAVHRDRPLVRYAMCRFAADAMLEEYRMKGADNPALQGWRVEEFDEHARAAYGLPPEPAEAPPAPDESANCPPRADDPLAQVDSRLAETLRRHRERPVQGSLEL